MMFCTHSVEALLFYFNTSNVTYRTGMRVSMYNMCHIGVHTTPALLIGEPTTITVGVGESTEELKWASWEYYGFEQKGYMRVMNLRDESSRRVWDSMDYLLQAYPIV